MGLRQARLVSQLSGIVSVVLLGLGVAKLATRRAGLIAALLLATSYVTVMYDRAALMEASMVAWMVVAWWAYARSSTAPAWGVVAGVAALLAFFTKASAIFFLAALGLDAAMTLLPGYFLAAGPEPSRRSAQIQQPEDEARIERQGAMWTLAGLGVGSLLAMALFVGPNWREYRFYNLQMSVTRKPSYTLRALMDRASWLPIIHDFFTRLWLVSIVAAGAALSVAARWRTRPPAERLLVLWIALGTLELILHDVGNERRLVFLIPPMVALAALAIGRDRRLLAPDVAELSRARALLWSPVVLFMLYVLIGAFVRLLNLYETRPGVRLSAAGALIVGIVIFATWPKVPRWLASEHWSPRAAWLLAGLLTLSGIAQVSQWASGRTYKNYEASRAVGRLLPPDTLVHGKLANGLSLENRIRPVFVGDHFGNYDDRLSRDDIRYILTYIAPREGYEGPIIREVLAAYPHRRLIATFDVAESAGGADRAALFEKGPRGSSASR